VTDIVGVHTAHWLVACDAVTVHAIDATSECSVAAMNSAEPLHHCLWRNDDVAPTQRPVRMIRT